MNYKSKLKQLDYQHSKFPIPKEYKILLHNYADSTYKWIGPINHMLIWKERYEKETPKISATGMKRLAEFYEIVGRCCEIRSYFFSLTSMLLMLGFNYPSERALKKLERLKDRLDTAMLDNLVILERYKTALTQHKKLNLKGCKVPETMEEIENSKDWISDELMMAFTTHGSKVLNLQFTTTNDPEISK